MPNDSSRFGSVCGLSEAKAQARLKTEGYNELPRSDQRTRRCTSSLKFCASPRPSSITSDGRPVTRTAAPA
jgi:hypothetical protein